MGYIFRCGSNPRDIEWTGVSKDSTQICFNPSLEHANYTSCMRLDGGAPGFGSRLHHMPLSYLIGLPDASYPL